MESNKTEIELILDAISENKDNVEWLSYALTTLASHLYYHNTQMADAELDEKRVIVDCLQNRKQTNGKPLTVAESEKRGVVETNNEYGKLKAQGEAVVEAINAIKTRLRILTWERKEGPND